MQGRLENEMKIQKSIEETLKNAPNFLYEWYLNMRASKKTASSCQDYIRKVKKFLEYVCDDIKNMDASEITLRACESYMISCQTKINKNGMIVYTSDSYQQSVWSALNSFLKFLSKRNYVEYNYMGDIERPLNRDLERINNERVLLTQREFNKILDAVKTGSDFMDGLFNNRDTLIILLFMTTGMRETALKDINLEDINLNEKTLTVVDKGNKTHIYSLHEQVIDYYYGWMVDRKKIETINSNSALFINRYGERISSHGVSQIVKKYCEAGIGKALSPHKLRSGFCSILYNKTKDVEFVRRVVGHTNIQTTQRYIKTDGKEKEKAIQIMSDLLNI